VRASLCTTRMIKGREKKKKCFSKKKRTRPVPASCKSGVRRGTAVSNKSRVQNAENGNSSTIRAQRVEGKKKKGPNIHEFGWGEGSFLTEVPQKTQTFSFSLKNQKKEPRRTQRREETPGKKGKSLPDGCLGTQGGKKTSREKKVLDTLGDYFKRKIWKREDHKLNPRHGAHNSKKKGGGSNCALGWGCSRGGVKKIFGRKKKKHFRSVRHRPCNLQSDIRGIKKEKDHPTQRKKKKNTENLRPFADSDCRTVRKEVFCRVKKKPHKV